MNDIGIEVLRLAAKGYCCSQILIQLALEARGQENPDLVRAMAGLCMGGGNSGNVCGIYTGACCLLALVAGKGSDAERASDQLPLMFDGLEAWFVSTARARHGGMLCTDIRGETPGPNPDTCGRLLVAAWDKVIEILTTHGFDERMKEEG